MLWLDKPEHWDALAERCEAAGVIGLDTEFYNVNVKKQSCVGRARIHVWSIALRTAKRSPLGHAVARGWVLPVDALGHPGLRAMLENPATVKAIHNQSVDQHTLANHGVRLAGAVNTLGLCRWHRPELVSQPGRFGLKALMGTMLHREPVCSFKELVTDTRTVQRARQRTIRRTECSCGTPGCRLRKGHLKRSWEESVEVITERQETFQHPLESIVPGHPRWELLLRYAAEDAVAALELMELAEAVSSPAPFPFAPERPAFSQALEDEIVAMESVGIPIDVRYCERQLATALADEERDYEWLFAWYVRNAPAPGPHRREDVDPIWTSPKQRLALFDALDFPHSPVWKFGRVKRGEVKMDGVAQAWIGKAHPPAAPLMKRLLHLQRVHAGKKYLTQMIASGGMAYPTAGPASDNDERSGAVTGRIGMKTELSGQQLPSRSDVDPYKIKMGVISWPNV